MAPLYSDAKPVDAGGSQRSHLVHFFVSGNVARVTRRLGTLLLLAGLAALLGAWTSSAQGQSVIHACYGQLRDDRELHLITPGHPCVLPGKELVWNKRGPRGLPGEQGKEGPAGEEGPPGKHEWCKRSGWHVTRGSCTKGKSGGFRATFEEIVKFVATLLAATLTSLLALLCGAYISWLLLLQLLTRWSRTKDRWPARWVRRPRLSIEKFDDSALSKRLGPAITGLIRTQLGPQNDRFGLEYASGEHAVATALDGFKDLSGAARAAILAVNLLTATLPRRRYVVCGELQPRGPAGPGLSLALRDAKGYHGMVALWAEPLEVRERGTAAYQRMAIPAAAWADACMASMIEDTSFSIDARSWAFSRSGLESQRLGNDDAARSLYEQALGHDGSNAQALANLGLLERRRRDFARAKELLVMSLEVLERHDQSWPRRDQDWYRAHYQLAALALNKASESREQHSDAALEEDRQSALEVTREVARIATEAVIALNGLAKRAPSRTVARTARRLATTYPDERLARFLSTTVEPSALLLLAGALLLGSDEPSMRKVASRVPSREELLRDLLDDGAEADADAPYRLAAYVEGLSDLAPRVLYNLACFYTRVGEFEKAQRRLEQALLQTPVAEREALRRVVRNDITLDKLRELRNLDWD